MGISVPNGSFAVTAAHEIVRGNECGTDNYQKWLLERHNNCCYDYSEEKRHFSIFFYDDIMAFYQSMDRQEIELQKDLPDILHFDFLRSLKICISEQNYIQCKINGHFLKPFCSGETLTDEGGILLYGFDDTKQIFYGRVMTKDFKMIFCEIPYCEVVRILVSADEKTTWLDFWFYWWKVGDSNVYEKFICGISDYINSCNHSSTHSVNRVFGIKAIEVLITEIQQNMKSGQEINMIQVLQFLNHKYYMTEKIRYIVETKGVDLEFLEFADNVYTSAQKIYTLALQYNKEKTVGEIFSLMQHTIECERAYMPALISQLSECK